MNTNIKLEQGSKVEASKVKNKLENDLNDPENALDRVSIVNEEEQSLVTIKKLEVKGMGVPEKADREQLSDDNKAEISLITVGGRKKPEKRMQSLGRKEYRCVRA